MIKKLVQNMMRHAYLVVSLAVLVIFLIMGQSSKKLTFEMVLVVAIFYFLGAFIHHLHDKTLTFEVTMEYLLLAGLMLVILVSFFV